MTGTYRPPPEARIVALVLLAFAALLLAFPPTVSRECLSPAHQSLGQLPSGETCVRSPALANQPERKAS